MPADYVQFYVLTTQEKGEIQKSSRNRNPCEEARLTVKLLSKNRKPTTTMSSSPSSNMTDGSRTLQDRLHDLISRLSSTIEMVKKWPEAGGDDASIHVEETTKLIASIRQVIASLQKVEEVIKTDKELKTNLDQCLIPLDLLDLLDQNLNPDCFSRGLLREALGQLAGLKRRKLALEMLGTAVQIGLNKRNSERELEANATKRVRQQKTPSKEEQNPGEEPPTKKQRVATASEEANR